VTGWTGLLRLRGGLQHVGNVPPRARLCIGARDSDRRYIARGGGVTGVWTGCGRARANL
jgi:hypothetical protein